MMELFGDDLFFEIKARRTIMKKNIYTLSNVIPNLVG